MRNIDKHMKMLFTLARDLESVKNSRHAAGIFYKGRLISVGFSQYKTHPYAAKYNTKEASTGLHAEIDAIYKAKKYLSEVEMKKAVLVVVRAKTTISKRHKESHHMAYSKPCEGCSNCISDHGIKKIIYSQDSDETVFRYVTELR